MAPPLHCQSHVTFRQSEVLGALVFQDSTAAGGQGSNGGKGSVFLK